MVNVLELLHPSIRELWFERGFSEPTPPQTEAMPLILRGENVLIVALTGTGKTEAAFLPVLPMMLSGDEGREGDEGIELIYITPSGR